ncbi:MAG: anthranilate phosphoribosyltransferase [Synergistetes bacterium]|nr:anthranilate phosphoribosyltransferase [Synergistota bacterium]MCX8128004.1 anthranilate phosphoribosyltransferase [Synergistota bacterium]MDW8192801.1 anthranilate phosphoribosyltransferase [Synergistota bacterium]
MFDELYKDSLEKILEGKHLSFQETATLMEAIVTGVLTNIQVGALLIALRAKGETPEEISGAAKTLLEKSIKINVSKDILVDTCGTGGDMLKTFNISTIVALVCAAAGIPIAKHGNRSVSSESGSADLLSELGVKIELSPEKIKQSIEEINIGFIFAPAYHTAMKNVAPIRKELKTRTMFNLLGPLINPAFPTHQLLGVYDERLLKTVAQTLKNLGRKRAMVVHGSGADELCTWGINKVALLSEDGAIEEFSFYPEEVGIKRSRLEDIRGGKPSENAIIALKILNGEKGAKRDIVLLNAGAVFMLVGLTETIQEGIKIAAEVIDSGKAKEKLKELIKLSKEMN